MSARKSSYFWLSLLVILCVGCSGLSFNNGIGTRSRLPVLSAINSPEDAQRALVIAQDIRFSTLKILKYRVDNGYDVTGNLETYKYIDEKFRDTWSSLDKVVSRWKLTGNKEAVFEGLYQELTDHTEAIKSLGVE